MESPWEHGEMDMTELMLAKEPEYYPGPVQQSIVLSAPRPKKLKLPRLSPEPVMLRDCSL